VQNRREAGGGSVLSTFHLKPSTKRSAFTLIEMIGVMALIAILAAVAVPPLISRLETVDSAKEDANLEEIARALAEGIKATGTIPNPALAAGVSGSWTAIASNYTFLAPRLLATNFPARNARQIIFSPDLTSFVAANGFVTPATGWPDPLPAGDMRIYILASSKRNLPLLSGIPVADIAGWDKVYSNTGVIPVPSSVFGPNQTNKGEFFHVTSINLRPLFCRVELQDLAAPPTATVATAGTHSYPLTTGDPVNGSALGYSFNFIPSSGLGNAFSGGEAGILTTSPNQRILIDKTSVLTGFNIKDNGSTPSSPSRFSLSLPAAPQWEVNSMGVKVFPAAILPNINSFAIFLIKGTTLKLYDSAGSPNLLLNMQVTADSKYEYFNGSWTRVD
jgi:prepilin-type N-terminal cleavage/methylation domain-containing protein